MKVRFADSTGCPVPQIVVEAENEQDRILLRTFCVFPEYAKDIWKFHRHGYVCDPNGISSMNFGWIKTDQGNGYQMESDIYYNHGDTPVFISLSIKANELGTHGMMESKIIIMPGDGIDLSILNLKKIKPTPVSGNRDQLLNSGETMEYSEFLELRKKYIKIAVDEAPEEHKALIEDTFSAGFDTAATLLTSYGFNWSSTLAEDE